LNLRPTSRISVPTPFVADDLIYVASGYGRGIQPIYAITPGGTGDISLKEGSSSGGQIVLEHAEGAPYITTPIVYQGYLYICGYNGVLACYDAKTGERMYEQRLGPGASSALPPWQVMEKFMRSVKMEKPT